MARPAFTFTGLDISGGFLRAARCTMNTKGIQVHALHESALPPGTVTNGVITDPHAAGSTLRSLLLEHKEFSRTVVAGLPDDATYLLSVTIPNVDEHERDEAVLWEASQHIPVPIDALTLDWSVRETTAHGIVVEVAAAQTALVESYTAALEGADLRLLALEPLALTPLRIFSPTALTDPALVIRMDSFSNTVLFVTPASTIPVTFTTPSFSKSRVDRLLAEQLKLDAVERRKAIELFGFDAHGNDGRVRTAILDEFQRFMEEVRTQCSYVAHMTSLDFPTLYLLGQPDIRGLTSEIATALPVTIQDDASAFCLPTTWKNAALPASTLSRLAAILGLALHPL